MPIATPSKTREILKKYGFRPLKGFGQNFLIDQNIIGKIIKAADLKVDDQVVEIGPGIGSLTEAILDQIKQGKLWVIEKDPRMVKVLKDLFSGQQLEIIHDDVLKVNWFSFLQERKLLNAEVKVLANLPYYISTAVIMDLLQAKVNFSRLVLMVQKEVAQRMVAAPGGKEYGSLSIAVQYFSRAEIISKVPPTVFIPQPEVESAIISLQPYPKRKYEVLDEEFFFQVVQAIFQQRRKNIKNALSKSPLINLPQKVVRSCLEELGISTSLRGEKLSIKEMVELSNLLRQKSGE